LGESSGSGYFSAVDAISKPMTTLRFGNFEFVVLGGMVDTINECPSNSNGIAWWCIHGNYNGRERWIHDADTNA
jgi:hypothetical protein